MTPVQVAHLAGILDALARVRVRQTPGGTRLANVAISSPNMDLLNYVARLTGVKVIAIHRRYDRVGCDTHCDRPHLHVHSDTGRWELVGARAVIVLRAVQPYLTRLAFDVEFVLHFTEDAPTKPATVRKMVELGWVGYGKAS